MVDNTSTHSHDRKVGGVRFIVDPSDSLHEHEENPLHITELQWEQCCDHQRSFDLYFGILKLAHCYTMMMDVVFDHPSIKLETITDHQQKGGLELFVTECSQSHSAQRTSFQVEVAINPETTPGPFHRSFLLKEISQSSRSVTVNVSGKILRQGQGTATLKHGVHMKSIIRDPNDDDE